MKTTREILLVVAVSALLGACSRSQPQETPQTSAQQTQAPAADKSRTLKLAGTVVDAAGNPLTGATVEYWHAAAATSAASDLELKKQITTTADGAYEMEASRDMGFVLARKAGLAPAWKMLIPSLPVAWGDQKLVLTPPGVLTGTVMDQSNQPVVNAEVSVAEAFGVMQVIGDNARTANYLIGKPARDLFSARTDAAGCFRIDNFPTNASALFEVKATGNVLRQETIAAGSEMPGYRVGDADIKLILEPAGSIEGKIVCNGSNQTPPAARLVLQSDQQTYSARFGFEPVRSGAEGAFRIPDVADGSYHIRAMFGTNAGSEWVAEPVAVSVESGKVTRDVLITAQRGALLEVSALGAGDRKPLARVNVIAYRENSQSTAVTDDNGVARLHLLPGDYQIYASMQSMTSSQTSAAVQAGVTNRVEIDVAGPRKISGIVRGPDGRTAAGVAVRIVGALGPATTDIKTDVNGKFEMDWNQRQIGQNNSTPCILVRDAERNLAAAQDLDEDTTNVDLKLAPGLTLAGRAEFDGKPVTNATAALVFWTGNSGMWLQGLTRTNTPSPGRFDIPALPPGRKYGVIVSAPGHGQVQLLNFNVSDNPIREELDPVELKPASLKLSGQVLDADEKPVAGCYVYLNGDGQPNGNARTDHDGRFAFDHVCEGSVRLSANSQRSSGSISAEGGDTNVIIRLGQNDSSSSVATTHKLKGVVTDTNDKPAAGVQVAVIPNNGTRWVKTGANGEYNLTWSLQQWQIQNGGALLVVRDLAHNLAGTEELSEDDTNLDVKLKPALAFSGQVKNAEGASLSSAKITFWIKSGNSYDFLDQETAIPVNTDGRFEIKCLPADGQYMIAASANGFGRHQQRLSPEYESNRVELEPFALSRADRLIAGHVFDANDKPVSGASVQLNGEDQPEGNTTTDSKGRFHFQVCEGTVRLIAFPQSGGVVAQTTVEAGDTNLVINLRSSSGIASRPQRASIKGGPLPDLTSVNLTADAAPAGQAILLCLFDAGQRPSRHVIGQLNEQAVALRQKNIAVLGVQAAQVGDDVFNGWKSANPVSFPVGRVTEKSAKTRWASDASALPWLILADANHHVVAEGFSLDELDAQVQKLAK